MKKKWSPSSSASKRRGCNIHENIDIKKKKYIYIYIANTRPWNHFPFVSLESKKLTCMSFEVVYEPSATRGS